MVVGAFDKSSACLLVVKKYMPLSPFVICRFGGNTPQLASFAQYLRKHYFDVISFKWETLSVFFSAIDSDENDTKCFTLINFIVFDSLPIFFSSQIIFDLLSQAWDRTNYRCSNLVQPIFFCCFSFWLVVGLSELRWIERNALVFVHSESTSFCVLALFMALTQ